MIDSTVERIHKISDRMQLVENDLDIFKISNRKSVGSTASILEQMKTIVTKQDFDNLKLNLSNQPNKFSNESMAPHGIIDFDQL